jgi:type I restriction enzyme, S subunit
MVITTQNTKQTPGYKQSEIGEIPEDWKLKTLKDICRVNQGLQIAIENRLKNPTKKSKIYITIQYLNDGKDIEYINDYTPSVCCGKDDILMTRTRNTGIVISGVDGVFHNNFFKVNYDKFIIVKDFLIYYLNLKRIQNIILTKAGTSTIPDLNHNDFYSIPIPLPTKAEQTAIATVLSDIDSLILSLDRLITKKRDIKQATMQQLLTGKTRLPGFRREWVVKKLGEIAYINMGQSPDSKNYNVKGIGMTLIQGNADIENRKSISRVWTTQISKTCNEGDLIMTVRAPVGSIGIATKESCLGRGVCSLKCISDDRHFIFHSIVFLEGKWKTFGQGSTFASANSSQIAEFPLPIPDSIEEQQAIAAILSDMDAEIAALEQKRDKTHALKQGMMQELLTGKTRLV